ncbi:MAG: S41 family peptidase [Caldilineaceae bacterium]
MKRFIIVVAILLGVGVFGAVAFGAGLFIGNNDLFTPTIVRTSSQPTQFDVFWQAWNLIETKFVDRKTLDTTQLVYGAIRGMVEALGDTGHTAFLDPKERAMQETAISGQFTGIGAELGQRDGLPIIVAAFDGSPAQKAGVKAGDVILKVDGEDVSALSLSEISAKIRGPANTKVSLSLFRQDGAQSQVGEQSIELTITRGEITIPIVNWTMIPETQIALVRLSQFSEKASSSMISALQDAKAAGAKALIVDVRNNPGGLLEQAVKVTSQFLNDGNVLLEADADDNRTPFAVEKGGVATDLPMVVLINPGSASAAEIFAGAIQDHQRGQLIGETTFGTGTVLQPFALSDGSALLLGTRQWLTPNGRLIRKQGIKPDIEVTLPAQTTLLTPDAVKQDTLQQVNESGDLQLQKAIELLTKK